MIVPWFFKRRAAAPVKKLEGVRDLCEGGSKVSCFG
jgi:hypothetical protein